MQITSLQSDLMQEIDEGDEVVDEQQRQIRDPKSKAAKLAKHRIKEDIVKFDSGEHFVKKEATECRMQEEAKKVYDEQGKLMEKNIDETHKKRVSKDNILQKPVHFYNSEI